MDKIINLFSKIKYFINYLYYFKSSLRKNVYPYKLISKKITSNHAVTIISYRTRGQNKINEISLQELLNNKKLIDRFHPLEAVKLGSIAFEDIILNLPSETQNNKFNQIRNIMLSSVHDLSPNKESESTYFTQVNNNISFDDADYIDNAEINNTYVCKLVGGKFNFAKSTTTIIFTILGKREGYTKLLHDVIADKKLLSKFHPTEAVKFGFISTGDDFFKLSEIGMAS